MARVGFKKTYPAGSFSSAAVQALFGLIKSYVSNAGFNVLINTADTIDFIRMGSPAGTADDDVPHWAIKYGDFGTYGVLWANAVYGADCNDPAALAYNRNILQSNWLSSPPQELTIWFVADGVEGLWWLNGTEVDAGSASGYSMRFAHAGVISRRYPSDYHQGLCARYGIWDAWGDWMPAYAKDELGITTANIWTGTWSPFGVGWTYNGKRHPGSPMPKMAVPQFPNCDGGVTARVLGEFNGILVLTDGYTLEEQVIPGWMAFIGSQWDPPYAAPAPSHFDVL